MCHTFLPKLNFCISLILHILFGIWHTSEDCLWSKLLWKGQTPQLLVLSPKNPPGWAPSSLIVPPQWLFLPKCLNVTRYKAAPRGFTKIPQFPFTCSLSLFVLMLPAKSRNLSILTCLERSPQSIWLFNFQGLSIAHYMSARSLNPAVAQESLSEHESLSKAKYKLEFSIHSQPLIQSQDMNLPFSFSSCAALVSPLSRCQI